MTEFLSNLFSADLMPRGECYLWRPEIVWLHVLSDAVLAASYFSIPIGAIFVLYRRPPDHGFRRIFAVVAAFLFAEGCMHLMEIWTLWSGVHRLSGVLKLGTAGISVAAAVGGFRLLVPSLLSSRGPNDLGDRSEHRPPELVAMRNQLQAILDHANAAIFLKGIDGRYLRANRYFASQLQMEPEEIEGKRDREIFGAVLGDRVQQDDHEVIRTGETKVILEDRTATDGLHHLLTARFPVKDQDGRIYAVGGISTDVTEQRKMEIALEIAQRESHALASRIRRLYEAAMHSEWSLPEQIRAMLRLGCEVLELDYGLMTRVEDKGYRVEYSYARDQACPIQEKSRFAKGETYHDAIRMPAQDEVFACEKISPSRVKDMSAHETRWTGAVIGVPLLIGKKVYGTLEFVSHLPRETPFAPSDKDFVKLMARWVESRLEANLTEKALVESRSVYHSLVENLSVNIWMKDASGRFTFGNRQFYEDIGTDKEHVLGKTVHDFFPPAVAEKMEQSDREAMNKGAVVTLESEFSLPSGRSGYLRVIKVPVRDAEERIVGIQGAAIDVTEVRVREEKLKQSYRELDKFTYAVSHDLRAPLRAIQNLSQWVIEDVGDQLPEESRQHLLLLQGRSRRMSKYLDELLAYSRIGRADSQTEKIQVGDLVREAVELAGIPESFTLKIAEDLPVLQAQKAPLQQVFLNLIANAARHHDREDGTIEVGWEDRGDAVEFFVRDDGPGIHQRYHERIFEVFQTLAPRDKKEGSGMGLAFVKKTVETFGGSVQLTSAEGQGATFRFTWPKSSVQRS